MTVKISHTAEIQKFFEEAAGFGALRIFLPRKEPKPANEHE